MIVGSSFFGKVPERRSLAVFFIVLLAGVLLSGCLAIKAPPVSRSTAPAVLVDYQRTGGITGLNDRLVIFDNGAGLISSRNVNTEITVNTTELELMNGIFGQAGYPTLEPGYTSGHGGAALIQYTITYGNKTVKTEDSAIPSRLQPVIDELNTILRQGLEGKESPSMPVNLTT